MGVGGFQKVEGSLAPLVALTDKGGLKYLDIQHCANLFGYVRRKPSRHQTPRV